MPKQREMRRGPIDLSARNKPASEQPLRTKWSSDMLSKTLSEGGGSHESTPQTIVERTLFYGPWIWIWHVELRHNLHNSLPGDTVILRGIKVSKRAGAFLGQKYDWPCLQSLSSRVSTDIPANGSASCSHVDWRTNRGGPVTSAGIQGVIVVYLLRIAWDMRKSINPQCYDIGRPILWYGPSPERSIIPYLSVKCVVDLIFLSTITVYIMK